MPSGRASDDYKGGPEQTLQRTVRIGTGAVSTETDVVAKVPKNCRVTGIRYYSDDAPTGTSLTAEIFARTAAGAAGVSLQSAPTDIKFASQAAARAGVAASLNAANARRLAKDRLLEVVITATGITAGPGDILIVVEYEPVL